MLGDPTTGEYWHRLYGVDEFLMNEFLIGSLLTQAPEVYYDPVRCRYEVQELLESGRLPLLECELP